MSSKEDMDLARAARALKGASPVNYDQFVQALQTYTGQHMAKLLTADAASILHAQGFANGVNRLARVCANCNQIAEEYDEIIRQEQLKRTKA